MADDPDKRRGRGEHGVPLIPDEPTDADRDDKRHRARSQQLPASGDRRSRAGRQRADALAQRTQVVERSLELLSQVGRRADNAFGLPGDGVAACTLCCRVARHEPIVRAANVRDKDALIAARPLA